MGSSSPQTSTVTTEVPEESKPFLYGERGILPRAQALSEQPMNLPDYQVAGFSQPQMQAFNVAQSGIGGYMPALAQATQGGIGAAGQALGLVPATLSGAQGYLSGAAQGTGQAVDLAQAGLMGAGSQTQGAVQSAQPLLSGAAGTAQQAYSSAQPLLSRAAMSTQQAARSAQPLLSRAAQTATQSLSAAQPFMGSSAGLAALSAGQYDPSSSYRAYMNPFMEDVVRQSESDIARQGKMQEQQLRSQAVGAGAFGGSRQAVAERELGRNVAEQQARTSTGLRAQGFEQAQAQAQQAFEQQQQRGLSASQILGGLGTSYGQLGLQGAGQLAGIGTSGAEVGLRGAGQLADIGTAGGQLGLQTAGQLAGVGATTGQLGLQGAGQMADIYSNIGQVGLQGAGQMANLGSTYGQLGLQGAGQLGALGQGLGALGTQMAGLGELGQQLNIRDVGTLMDVGTAQQAQSQAGLDALRQNQYQRVMSPYQQLGFFSDIYQGLPVGQTSTTSAPGPSAISQIGGLATGIYGLTRPRT